MQPSTTSPAASFWRFLLAPMWQSGRRPKPVKSKKRSSEAGRRILIVEDSDQLGEIMAAILRMNGHTVRRVETLKEAKDAIEEEKPEVLLLDLSLPDST